MIAVDVYVQGLRVKRGPDWDYDDQDKHGLGTIINNLEYNWVTVKWDYGVQDNYKIHPKQDLSLADDNDINRLIKVKYPIGTVFNVLGYSDGRKHIIKNHLLTKNDTGWYFNDQYGYVYYHDNKWATIVKEAEPISTKPKVPTLEELRAMYPVGTKFKPVNEHTGNHIDEIYTVEPEWQLDQSCKGSFWFKLPEGNLHHGYIWSYKHPDIYAEIVSKPDVKPKVPTLGELKAMYPVGTEFRPVKKGHVESSIYTVMPYWKLVGRKDISNDKDYWFIDSNGNSQHLSYIWQSDYPDVYAKIISKPSEKTLSEQLPDDGAVYYHSKLAADVLAVLIGLGKTKHNSPSSLKNFKYLAWNNDSYWYCAKTEKELFNHPLNIETDEEEHKRSTSGHDTSVKQLGNSTYSYTIEEGEVQRPHQQIRRPNEGRGIRFEGTESKESIGSNYLKRQITIGRGEGEIEPSDLRRPILTRK